MPPGPRRRLTACFSCFAEACASAGEAKFRSLGGPVGRGGAAAAAARAESKRAARRSFMPDNDLFGRGEGGVAARGMQGQSLSPA